MSQMSENSERQFSDASDHDMDLPVNTPTRPALKRKLQCNLELPTLKRHNSLPDVRATQARTSKRAPSAKQQSKTKPSSTNPSLPFREMLVGTFKDPMFQEGISPMISSLVAPLIQQSIQSAVETAVSQVRDEVIKPIMASHEKLIRLVTDQRTLITKQQTRIMELESEYDFLCTEMDDMKFSVNDLEQYGRRNNLRISKMIGPPGATEAEVMQHTVKFLNENVLKASSAESSATPVTTDDIDRCHPIGQKRHGKSHIIIKFHKYRTKQAIYQSKKNLKGDTEKRFISEDLTRHNYGLVQSLTNHRRSGHIHSFWTRDGNVFAKLSADDRPTKVRSEYDINDLMGRPNRPPAHVVRRESNRESMDTHPPPLHD